MGTFKAGYLNCNESLYPKEPNCYPKWFTPSLKHQTNCLKSLRKRFSKSPTEHLKERLQTAEVNLAEQISSAKSDYESKLIQDFADTNQAKIFRYIKDLTKSDYIPQRLFNNDCDATDDIDKATMFNNYFYSVFTSSSTTSPVHNTMDTNVDQQIVSITVSEHDTYEALSTLNPCKAVGIDDIGPKVLRGCAISLYKPFHYLYYTSEQTDIIYLDF